MNKIEPRMYKIAIIKDHIVHDYRDDDYGFERKIVDSITDWETISDADYAILRAASARLGFTIIEQPTDTPSFIAKSIADYKKLVAQDEAKREAERKERERKALERKHKKELKDRESKKELLARLKKELGEV